MGRVGFPYGYNKKKYKREKVSPNKRDNESKHIYNSFKTEIDKNNDDIKIYCGNCAGIGQATNLEKFQYYMSLLDEFDIVILLEVQSNFFTHDNCNYY